MLWHYHLNLHDTFTYRGREYEFRNILSELIEFYTDILIEEYEEYCCEDGMCQYSGCIAGEIEFGRS